jgi:septal ring factor EnvC (AmiA/AmiB activator)
MRCAPIANLLQRARQLGETEEELDREEHHSVQSLQASDEEEEHIDSTSSEKDTGENATESTIQRRQMVKWPASTEKTSW